MPDQHEPYCNRQHTSRERCNSALEQVTIPEQLAAAPTAPSPADETPGSATHVEPRREPATATLAHAPASPARREWEHATAAVERISPARPIAHAAAAHTNRRPLMRKLALVGGGLAVMGVVAFILRDGPDAGGVAQLIIDGVTSNDDAQPLDNDDRAPRS